jgi:hypothetical protein
LHDIPTASAIGVIIGNHDTPFVAPSPEQHHKHHHSNN